MPENYHNKQNLRLTHRQMIAQLLETGPHSCRELSQMTHQSEKQVLEHLEHLRLSLDRRGLTLSIEPAVCRHCDFIFKNRQRLAKPGKCPKCRHTGIEPPLYTITGAEHDSTS